PGNSPPIPFQTECAPADFAGTKPGTALQDGAKAHRPEEGNWHGPACAFAHAADLAAPSLLPPPTQPLLAGTTCGLPPTVISMLASRRRLATRLTSARVTALTRPLRLSI